MCDFSLVVHGSRNPRHRGNSRRWAAVWLVSMFSMIFLAGCDECSLHDATCDGNVAKNCTYEYSESDAPLVWEDETCAAGRFCRVGTTLDWTEAVCAVTAEPDPLCQTSWPGEGRGVGCDGSIAFECNAGYRTSEVDCGSVENCHFLGECIK